MRDFNNQRKAAGTLAGRATSVWHRNAIDVEGGD
jgi:hypothetical protein